MSISSVRLGLFLVYTLPPRTNLTEGKEIPDSDLSQDTQGTQYNTRPQLIQYITCLMDDKFLLVLTRTRPLCVVAQSSGPASLIWIRNQLLLALCEILNSESLLIKE